MSTDNISQRKLTFPGFLLLCVFAVSGSAALAATGGSPTAAGVAASSTYYNSSTVFNLDQPSTATKTQMIDCFNTGTCAETGTTVLRYPMPCAGSGASDCTGCYKMIGTQMVRIGDVTPNGTGAPTCVPARTETQIMVFVGSEMHCPSAAASCSDGELRLSCAMRTIAGADVGGTDQILTYDKECFSGRAHSRRARGLIITDPSPVPVILCDAGFTGPDGGPCTACSNTSYKSTQGSAACTTCSGPTPANAIPGSVTWTTAGTGRTSPNDCMITDFACNSPYVKNMATKTCDGAPGPSPSPTPGCDPTTTMATSSMYVNCAYQCPGSVETLTITSGVCSNSSAINKIKTSRQNCSAVVPATCNQVPPIANTCASATCPAGKYKYLLWDVTGYAKFRADDAGSVDSSTGSTCALDDGVSPYIACGSSGTPPSSSYPADFGSCSGFNGAAYYGTKSYTTAPWNGNGYCSW